MQISIELQEEEGEEEEEEKRIELHFIEFHWHSSVIVLAVFSVSHDSVYEFSTSFSRQKFTGRAKEKREK